MEKYTPSELEKMANNFLSERGYDSLVSETKEIDINMIDMGNPHDEKKNIIYLSNNGEGELNYHKNNEKEFYIDFINSSASNYGIGENLLQQLEEKAYMENIQLITGRISLPNTNARKFFSKRGFKEKEIDKSVFPPEILVKKDLFYSE